MTEQQKPAPRLEWRAVCPVCDDSTWVAGPDHYQEMVDDGEAWCSWCCDESVILCLQSREVGEWRKVDA